MYLIRKRITQKSKAHYWTGSDTACRMYSTGGLNKDRYKVFYDNYGLSICTMCKEVKKNAM